MHKIFLPVFAVSMLATSLVACPDKKQDKPAEPSVAEHNKANANSAEKKAAIKANDRDPQVVVIYVSEDQVFSQPILKDFEQETGIKVKALYDTEESKSTGVMNRLIAEKSNPQADIYWANEPVRAEVLRQKDILQVYHSPQAAQIPKIFKNAAGYWTGFSARARVLVVNSAVKNPPTTVAAYNDAKWKGQAVLANPLFGTTSSHFSALFSLWGDEKAKTFLRKIKQNDVAIATSNGESADFVASGQYKFSLVDSDDAVNRMRQKKALTMIYPDQGQDDMGVFIVPNTVMMIRGAKHEAAAKKLIDYLLSPQSESKLAFADCAQMPLHPGVKIPPELKAIDKLKVMQIDYADLAKKMLQIQPLLKDWVDM